MRKRILCCVLTLILMASLLAPGIVTVSAATDMTSSDEAIRILKLEEGFSAKPYWDYAQWTVGYGTRCPDDKLEEYKKNGISKEAAEALLRKQLNNFESEVNKFIRKTGISANQNQFDAMTLFSYNCGTSWLYQTTGVLYKAIVSGATGNELINAFSRWCYAGGEIKTFLLRRRLCEANMYINGQYSQQPPANFGYALFDANGGTCSPNVQGYDTDLTAAIGPIPKRDGCTFTGWYTARTGGTKVEILDASVKNARLYAQWLDGEGEDPNQKEENGVTVTVNTNGVNVRKGPGTNYAAISKANAGEQLVITETKEGTPDTWGKFSGGWICLMYTNYDEVTKEEEKPTPTKKMGTVKVNDVLRVRKGPSTGYAVVDYLQNGTRVEILEEKLNGSMRWGRIEKGWISMDYVTLDPEKTPEPTVPETTVPPTTTPPTTVPPTTVPPTTVPPTTQPTVPEEKPQNPPATAKTGKVKVSGTLRIRSGPSTSNKIVGYLNDGDKVTITEETTTGSMSWGKIDKGWISLSYVVFDKTEPQEKITGTVKVTDFLRIRKGPGTSYAITGYLYNKDRVTITEKKVVGGMTWGKIDKGWISLSYVVLDKQETAPAKVIKTVTADCLRVRKAPGTTNAITGYLYKGTKVEILKTQKVGNTTWGQVSKGWISMDYVK